MVSSNFIQIPRTFRTDSLWIGFSSRERHAYEEFLYNMAFRETIQDDHGEIIIIKPGQYMTTIREFAELCNKTKPSDMKKFDRSFVERFFEKMERCHFSRQEVRHKKTILTCTKEDIMDLIETGIETKVRQDRDKSETQKNTVVKTTTVVVVPDKPEKLKVDDVYHWAVKTNKNWSNPEIEEAHKSYLNSKSIIDDPLAYVEGIIKKKRIIKENKKTKEKPCQKATGTTSSEKNNEFYSENDTSESPLAKFARHNGLK